MRLAAWRLADRLAHRLGGSRWACRRHALAAARSPDSGRAHYLYYKIPAHLELAGPPHRRSAP